MRCLARAICICALLPVFLATRVTAQGVPPSEAPIPALPMSIVGADPTLERETENLLLVAYAELYRASGFPISDTVRVVYVAKNQSFDSVVGGRFPDWGVAAAVAERNLIAVRSPADHPLGRSLRETLRHELAHLHLDAMSGLHQLPRWMHEGYAQQFAHEWIFGDDFLIARAVFVDHTIDLRDIDGVNSFAGPRAQLAYAQSYLAMSHFLATYGWDGLLLFCQSLRDHKDWDEAFQASTGANYAGFEREFAEYLHKRYNWIAFLGDTILLWIGLAAVFVVTYILKRRRSAARRAEWEQQEAIEDILYGPLSRGDSDKPAPPENPPS